jgi:hypothetical protein
MEMLYTPFRRPFLFSTGPLLGGAGGVLMLSLLTGIALAEPQVQNVDRIVFYAIAVLVFVTLSVLFTRIGLDFISFLCGSGALTFATGWVHGWIEADVQHRRELRTPAGASRTNVP